MSFKSSVLASGLVGWRSVFSKGRQCRRGKGPREGKKTEEEEEKGSRRRKLACQAVPGVIQTGVLRLSAPRRQPLDLQAQLERWALPTSFTPVHPATPPDWPPEKHRRNVC